MQLQFYLTISLLLSVFINLVWLCFTADLSQFDVSLPSGSRLVPSRYLRVLVKRRLDTRIHKGARGVTGLDEQNA